MADPRDPVVMIGGVPVVDAPHEIDADNAECFDKLLLHAASCGRRTVVVNMTGTRFCDSGGCACSPGPTSGPWPREVSC